MNREICGETKAHEAHEWIDNNELPGVRWDQEPLAIIDMSVARKVCPGVGTYGHSQAGA